MKRAAARSDVGRKRRVNQDDLWINPECDLYILADGMGGHAAGETASHLAVEEIVRLITDAEGEDRTPTDMALDPIDRVEQGLRSAIKRANRRVLQEAASHAEYRGMGTTIVVCQIAGGIVFCAHVGDSRLYLLRHGELQQVTHDHSRVQELLDTEQITEEEARDYPLKNVITRALGSDESLEIDLNTFEWESSDVLLLCTDGLSSYVPKEQIRNVILQHRDDPDQACRLLIDLANEYDGSDNISVILVYGPHFGGESDALSDGTADLRDFSLYPDAESSDPIEPPAGFWSRLLRKFRIQS